MGEQSWARIEIGGTLPARHWHDLASRFDDDFYEGSENWRDTFDITLNEALAGRHSVLTFDGMSSWGNPMETMAFCRRHGLTYRRNWDAGGNYDHGAAFWRPGLDKEVEHEADREGSIVVPLSALQIASNEGRTLAEVIAGYDEFTRDLPPLTLTFEAAHPSLLQPAKSPEGEALRVSAGFHIYETRVRSLDETFDGIGLVVAHGRMGADGGHGILAEVRLGDSMLDPHVEVETNTLEIVDGQAGEA